MIQQRNSSKVVPLNTVKSLNRTTLINGLGERITLSTAEGIYIFHPMDIKWVQADAGYVQINLKNEQVICSSCTLKQFCLKIKRSNLIRIHQSILVNMDEVFLITSSHVKLKCGEKLPISRRKRHNIMTYVQV